VGGIGGTGGEETCFALEKNCWSKETKEGKGQIILDKEGAGKLEVGCSQK